MGYELMSVQVQDEGKVQIWKKLSSKLLVKGFLPFLGYDLLLVVLQMAQECSHQSLCDSTGETENFSHQLLQFIKES